MSNVDFDFSEVTRLAAELAAAGPKVALRADKVTSDVRDRMGDDAQANVPVRTGELRNSREDFDEGDEHGTAFTAAYAAYVEYGTSVMGPQPYMWPAAATAERSLTTEIEDIADPFTGL